MKGVSKYSSVVELQSGLSKQQKESLQLFDFEVTFLYKELLEVKGDFSGVVSGPRLKGHRI